MWPDEGVEKKGIIITSSEEVNVVSECLDPGGDFFQDAYQVRLQSNLTQEYFATSIPNLRVCTLYNHYLSVVTYEDDTDVLLTYNDGSDAAYNMDKYDVLTLKTDDHTDDFVSGTRISASKQVFVLSGNLCVSHQPDGASTGGGAAVTDVFSFGDYGVNFVAPSIGFPGYILNFIAHEDDTLVSHNGQTTNINAGDVYRYEYPYHDDIVTASCSKPCYLALYAFGIRNTYGNYLMNVLPVNQYYRSCDFVTMDYDEQHYVSIVAIGTTPVDDIMLDGVNLEDLDWQTDGHVSYVVIEVAIGFHHMNATKTQFAVYVFGHSGTYSGGYGYSVYGTIGTCFLSHAICNFHCWILKFVVMTSYNH